MPVIPNTILPGTVQVPGLHEWHQSFLSFLHTSIHSLVISAILSCTLFSVLRYWFGVTGHVI